MNSKYHDDALNHTIPLIINDLTGLLDGYDEVKEKMEAMRVIRKELKKIYAGEMNLA